MFTMNDYDHNRVIERIKEEMSKLGYNYDKSSKFYFDVDWLNGHGFCLILRHESDRRLNHATISLNWGHHDKENHVDTLNLLKPSIDLIKGLNEGES